MADSKKALFEQIDESMFGQVEKVSQSPIMNKYQEMLASQDELTQKIINQSISLFLSVFPLFLCMLIFLSNCSQRSEINTNKALLAQIDSYIKRQSEADTIGRNLVTTGVISTLQDMQNKIRTASEREGLAFSKLTVSNYISTKTSDSLLDNRADIAFNSFTVTDLTALLTALVQKEKMKIMKIDIQKEANTNLLKGVLNIVSFSKVTAK